MEYNGLWKISFLASRIASFRISEDRIAKTLNLHALHLRVPLEKPPENIEQVPSNFSFSPVEGQVDQRLLLQT
jgi:hypothetical protein